MNKEEKRYLKKMLNIETFNITGFLNGILVITHDVRIAKRIFRKSYPNQKIFHAKISGKINPKHIY